MLGRSGDHDRATPVADRAHRGFHRADVGGELGEQRTNALRFGVGDRDHRRAFSKSNDATTPRHQGSGRTDQLREREQFDVARAGGVERLDGKHTLGVTGHPDRRGDSEVQPLPVQGSYRRDLAQQHTGQRHRRRRQVSSGRCRFLGSDLAHPTQRLEADGPHHNQFVGDRFQQQFRLADHGGELRLDPGHRDEFFEVRQPRTIALSTEGHGVGLARVEPVHEGLHAGAVGVIAAQTVVLVDRHRCLSPSNGRRAGMSFRHWRAFAIPARLPQLH